MKLRFALLLSLVVLASCRKSPELAQAALAAIRIVPIDSLTFGACSTIELDPAVRPVTGVNKLNPAIPPAAVLEVPPESIGTRLPVTFRTWNADDPVSRAAQVIIGLLQDPRVPPSDTLSIVVVVTGCRLSGSMAYVAAWRSAGGYVARLRRIHEG